jgi:hypothetical protein
MRRTPIWLALILGTLAAEVAAELYKSVDEHGNVTYTDKSSDKAKPVEPPGLTTYKPATQHTQPSGAEAKPAPGKKTVTSYNALNVSSPNNNDTVRDNSGTVVVKVDLSPALDVQAGHKLVALLDGKSVTSTQAGDITLQNVDRGSHTVAVRVVDGSGRTLKESRAITFHLQRPSVTRRAGGK